VRRQFGSARKWTPKQLDDIGNVLSADIRITSRATESHQESDVTGDAIADSAETRQVDEKSFLENRGQGIVKVGCLGKPPQFFSDLGSFGSKPKEVREDAEAFLYSFP
jgi:hypothetical protein